jgi:hypothetical protein
MAVRDIAVVLALVLLVMATLVTYGAGDPSMVTLLWLVASYVLGFASGVGYMASSMAVRLLGRDDLDE